MLTRRDFLKFTGASTLGWYVWTRTGWVQRAEAAIPGGTLEPGDIDRFMTPLLIPPVMPRAGTIMRRGRPIDYYEISMRQFEQQILPPGLPETTVWGYGPVSAANRRALLIHNAPSLTIEANWNRPVRVKWINELVDENGDFLPHLLPVDPTLHWANPPGGTDGRDMRPEFTETPGPYEGPVPIVTHVHGSVSVGDESDGFAGPGTCRRPAMSRPAMRPKARGTATSRPRRPRGTAQRGARGSRRSSTRTPSARRRSGTTTIRSA
jgi:hypothetical protein